MVITPKQVNEKLNRKEMGQLRKLEAAIDQNLLEGKLAITIVGGMNPRIKQQLVNRYQHVGWDVNYQLGNAGDDCIYFFKHKEIAGFRPY